MYQKAFSVLELLVVLALIGFVASYGFQRCDQYVKRSKFTAVVSAAAEFKQAVTMCYLETNQIERCSSGQYGITRVSSKGTDVIRSIEVYKGFIVAVGGAELDYINYIIDSGVRPASNGKQLRWSVLPTSTCLKLRFCVCLASKE